MKSTTFFTLRRRNVCALRPFLISRRAVTRNSSTEIDPSTDTASLQTTLQAELTSRPLNKIVDFISPTPWNLLNTSLAEFLPSSCQAPNCAMMRPVQDFGNIQTSLPQSHHLLYFPPAVLNSDLIPDGTDSLHSPGAPYVKRLWAGGNLTFNHKERFHIKAHKSAVLGEDITDVNVKGMEGNEKIFVTVRRRVASMAGMAFSSSSRHKKRKRDGLFAVDAAKNRSGSDDMWAVIETRDLVFMKEKSEEEIRKDLLKVAKVLKPPHTPDFSVSVTPNAALLFRFSALTFNAHRIHLDPQYTREVEGYRNLLVHGPLTLVLMLSVLRSQVAEGKMIRNFSYKNRAPLYVDEEMKICVRRDPENEDKFDVWVEGKEGGYAVKGRAVIGDVELSTKPSKVAEAKVESEDVSEGSP